MAGAGTIMEKHMEEAVSYRKNEGGVSFCF